ncbi:hypothetical protein VTL71DRAFT_772 [Oculimacula yallundae]|uniref:Antifreeze protein n=1 Tax=Oculimacula yallundae TaxID=86028 RepID=A0ABR4D3B5_9HELO
MRSTTSIIVGFVLATPALAATSAISTCARDNLLRCIVATPSLAVPYCSSFLGISDSTTYIATTTPLTTTSTTTTTTVFTTTTTNIPAANKRELKDRAASSAPPACVTNQKTAYPASRISSACSCLGITPNTITLTATAPTSTIVDTSTEVTTSVVVATSIIQPVCGGYQAPCGSDSECCPFTGELRAACYLGTCGGCFIPGVRVSCSERRRTIDQCFEYTGQQCCSRSSTRTAESSYTCN